MPVILFAISKLKEPEILMMPTPPFPGGVAIAAMVSIVASGFSN